MLGALVVFAGLPGPGLRGLACRPACGRGCQRASSRSGRRGMGRGGCPLNLALDARPAARPAPRRHQHPVRRGGRHQAGACACRLRVATPQQVVGRGSAVPNAPACPCPMHRSPSRPGTHSCCMSPSCTRSCREEVGARAGRAQAARARPLHARAHVAWAPPTPRPLPPPPMQWVSPMCGGTAWRGITT